MSEAVVVEETASSGLLVVEVSPRGDDLELIAVGPCDPWTAGALLRTLTAVFEPAYQHVHVDLRGVTGLTDDPEQLLVGCRDYALEHHATFRFSPPEDAVHLLPAG